METCIFCKIANGEIPCYKIWEDNTHLAFLDINPEAPGMTIIIPKQHYASYIVNLDREVVCNLIDAVKKVAPVLDSKLENVLRTKVVFEGIDVDHLHAKLIPMYKKKPKDLSLEEVHNVLTK